MLYMLFKKKLCNLYDILPLTRDPVATLTRTVRASLPCVEGKENF